MNKHSIKQKFLVILSILCLLTTSLLTACDSMNKAHEVSGNTRPKIYTSFFPIQSMVETVVGKAPIDVISFMPQDKDPHLWEPNPREIQSLAEADLLIINGANMEERWLGSIRKALPDLQILTLSDGVDLITYKGAAALGDFQYLCKLDLKGGERYEIEFGHTHEDIIRVAFIEEIERENEKDTIGRAKKVMEAKGDLVEQKATIDMETDKVYGIEMGHASGLVYYIPPKDGTYYFISDRLSEMILSYRLLDLSGDPMELDEILSGSSANLDKITYDPHSWMSLINAKSYFNSIKMALSDIYPEYEKQFNKNKVDAVTKLRYLQLEYSKKFKNVERKGFVTTHYAYAYLARDFDLKQYPLQGLTSMAEPSLKTIRNAVNYCEASGVNTIFYEQNGSSKGAQAIAGELTGGKVEPLNSMEYVNPQQEEDMTYQDFLEMNLENIYLSLLDEEA